MSDPYLPTPPSYVREDGEGNVGSAWFDSSLHALAGGAVAVLLAKLGFQIVVSPEGDYTPFYRLVGDDDLAQFGIEGIVLELHPPIRKEAS